MIVTPKKNFQLLDNEPIHAITAGKRYVVLGIEYDDYRIVDDDGGPCLYPIRLFNVVEPSLPDGWTVEIDIDDEQVALHLGPASFNRPGFYEDLHDRDPHAINALAEYCKAIGVEWDDEYFKKTGGLPRDM